MNSRALIIAAPRSGSGKTSVTIGLLRALRRRGVAVAGVKSGPDFIDPGFHEAATGMPGVNLDSWAMYPELLNSMAAEVASNAQLVVVESAMGLFDGIQAGSGRTGAASDLARRYGLPVILILDVSGQSQSAAAMALGFARYDPDVRIAGVILNRLGSERHRSLAASAIEAIGIPVVGAIYRNPEMALPERHLGLVQASEHARIDTFIERLADIMESSLELDRIGEIATPFDLSESSRISLPPPGQRIALARDAAFTFVYPHLLRHWKRAGAEIFPFSPLADQPPDPDCDVCWLPGGYPELHAGVLAAASKFKAGMKQFAGNKPVHGECGGYMVLGEVLEDADGNPHQMLGLLGHSTSFAKRKMNLGYRKATLRSNCALGRSGQHIRGHEFHYARITLEGNDDKLADMTDGLGNRLDPSGSSRGNVTGTFFHAIAADES